MTWQAVVIIVVVLATCCFYKWCSVYVFAVMTSREIAETQHETAKLHLEHAQLQQTNLN